MSHCGVTTLHDEETQLVHLNYMLQRSWAQDIIIKIPLQMTTMITFMLLLFH